MENVTGYIVSSAGAGILVFIVTKLLSNAELRKVKENTNEEFKLIRGELNKVSQNVIRMEVNQENKDSSAQVIINLLNKLVDARNNKR